MTKPIVAIVGRPNVGKSTLFNRLVGEQLAVVDDKPGTTRDRLVSSAEWNGLTFDVVDTGGIETLHPDGHEPYEGSNQFIPHIRRQAEIAIREANAVLFITDVRQGLTSADREVADILRRHQKRQPDGTRTPPVILVVNKAENMNLASQAAEFYALGFDEPQVISAIQGLGTGDMLDVLVTALRQNPNPEEAEDDSLKIALVGKPNVGKSSLLNRLLGEERVIVSPIPGTTRDAIDTPFTFEGTPMTLIDTAGVRRRGAIDPGVEKWSVLRTFKALARADIALLVLDASQPFTAQDAHVAGYILEELKSVLVLVNKWDTVEKDEHSMAAYTDQVRQTLHFLDYVPLLFVSAKTGQRCGQILPTARHIFEERSQRVPTAALNQLVREAVAHHAPTAKGGRQLKISFASQVRANPPVFLFHVNEPSLAHFTYKRYLENRIRQAYRFLGTPIKLSFRKKE